MEEGKKYFIKTKLTEFHNKHAVLETEDGQKLNWPIKNLPDETKEGDNPRLVLSTEASDQEEREKTAREILNQILKD